MKQPEKTCVMCTRNRTPSPSLSQHSPSYGGSASTRASVQEAQMLSSPSHSHAAGSMSPVTWRASDAALMLSGRATCVARAGGGGRGLVGCRGERPKHMMGLV